AGFLYLFHGIDSLGHSILSPNDGSHDSSDSPAGTAWEDNIDGSTDAGGLILVASQPKRVFLPFLRYRNTVNAYASWRRGQGCSFVFCVGAPTFSEALKN